MSPHQSNKGTAKSPFTPQKNEKNNNYPQFLRMTRKNSIEPRLFSFLYFLLLLLVRQHLVARLVNKARPRPSGLRPLSKDRAILGLFLPFGPLRSFVDNIERDGKPLGYLGTLNIGDRISIGPLVSRGIGQTVGQ